MAQHRILVLDDRKTWRTTIERFLRNDFVVKAVEDPEDAIKEVKAGKYFLVIIDKDLGGVSGLDVLSDMRKIDRNLRAIILTGNPDPTQKDAFESGKRGALAYLLKDNWESALIEVIEELKAKKPIVVFLSYAREDYKQVSSLHRDLTASGFSSWMDTDRIKKGPWQSQLEEAINEADLFVACLSSRSVEKVGTVQREFKLALEKQKKFPSGRAFIIPVRLEDCRVPEEFTGFHWIDLFEKGGLSKLKEALWAD